MSNYDILASDVISAVLRDVELAKFTGRIRIKKKGDKWVSTCGQLVFSQSQKNINIGGQGFNISEEMASKFAESLSRPDNQLSNVRNCLRKVLGGSPELDMVFPPVPKHGASLEEDTDPEVDTDSELPEEES